jgi:hypothetical protein
MPIITQILCDGCQAVKKETNHWYTLVVENGHQARLTPMAHTPSALLLPGASNVSYFCGRQCAMEAIADWMDRVPTHRNLAPS